MTKMIFYVFSVESLVPDQSNAESNKILSRKTQTNSLKQKTLFESFKVSKNDSSVEYSENNCVDHSGKCCVNEIILVFTILFYF